MDELTLYQNDSSAILQELNDEKAVLMVPVIVYLVILMAMGIPGNILVCYYYWFKTRSRTTNYIFICTVALYDLVSCSLSIPVEIVDLRYFYMFTDTAACKFLRFINHFAVYGSIVTLLVVAVDRYRRICHPFKKQLSLKQAKLACGGSILFAVFFSWPALLFYSTVPVPVENDHDLEVTGSDCTTQRDDGITLYLNLYNGLHLLAFLACAVALCVLYSIVGRVLLRHSKLRQQTMRTVSDACASNTTASSTLKSNNSDNQAEPKCDTGHEMNQIDVHDTNAAKTQVDDDVGNDMVRYGTQTTSRDTNLTNGNLKSLSASLASIKPTLMDAFDMRTVKYTMIMLVITVVFIVSFVPHLSLIIWRTFLDDYEVNVLSDSGLVAFQIGLRSYFLNSAINPLTYGFFNSKFRAFFFKIACPFRRSKVEKSNINTSSGS